MHILLLSHSFNSLTQRLHVELRDRGHDVAVELGIHAEVTRESLALHRPDLVIRQVFETDAITAWKPSNRPA
ncbi:hypothetical protein QCM80_41790 [Bradyrhizobium sp. SSUT112]|uniref:hypothetical protein n=1 Tax=Bradyrhizobium sp. SSUT112 TaxID=3040604 RepID=UPI0024482F70|nr:hypothetical protein [Bradyrhizobium sp. SSUT112]MDH2357074.1 hypothetical protein [Bradyrhizobium sp. SSUT112]